MNANVKIKVTGTAIRLSDGRYRKKDQTFSCEKSFGEYLVNKFPNDYKIVKEKKTDTKEKPE